MSRTDKDRMLLFTILGSFVLLLLLVVAVATLFWFQCPKFMGALLVFLWLSIVLSSLSRRIAVARILGGPYPPRVGSDSEYVGRYMEHWEVGHILVFTGYKWFGLLPVFERWLPEGPSDLPSTPVARKSAQHYVHFTGMVGEAGHFGHLGTSKRRIKISSVIDAHAWPDERRCFF